VGRGREPISELAVAVGDRLRSVRRDAGRSQAWVAEAIEITQGSVSNYESGLRDIPVNLLLSALQALEYDAGQFFEDLPGLISPDAALNGAVRDVRERCWPA
jgi:transcriptional regulator with XRE-family HTH domain